MLAAIPQSCAAGARLSVDTIESIAPFESLRLEWRELLESSASDNIFLTWEWMFTWWKHLSQGRKLSVLAIRDRGELVALAPLCVAGPAPLRARLFSSVQFLGSGFVGSDYLDLIVRAGYEDAVEKNLASYIARPNRPIEWAQLAFGESYARRVAQTLSDRGWQVREAATSVCPFIALRGHTWESYLATLGSEHRYNFRRKWRRLSQEHSVTLHQPATRDQCDEYLDLLMDLHNLRWRGRGASNAFHTQGLVSFHREWSRLAFDRGWLRIHVLRVDGAPAAALYGFVYGNKFNFYQAGFDPAFAKSSVGLIIMGVAIQSAIAEGVDEYDLLHGNEDYKSHWSHEQRALSRIEIDPPGLRGWISQSLLEFARGARRVARKGAR